MWCFNVSVQNGFLLRVHLAAYTADAAIIEGQYRTIVGYCISPSSARKKTMFSICIFIVIVIEVVNNIKIFKTFQAK